MSTSIAAIGGGATSFQPLSANLLPQLDYTGAKLVSDCAFQAQQKYLHDSGSNSLHNSNDYLLRGLPINQPIQDSTQRQGALFCRSGTWLEIVDRRTAEFDARRNHMSHPDYVRGTRKETSRFTILEFLSVAFGLVSIRGLESQMYLCMDNKGRLYGAPSQNYTSECVFMEEMLENYYNLYSSCAFHTKVDTEFGTRKRRPWYVALRRSGRPRKGRNARKKQKSSHFLVIHFDDTRKNSKSVPPKNTLYETSRHNKPDSLDWIRGSNSGLNPSPESSSSTKTHPQLTLSEILSNSLSSKWPARQMYEQFKRKQFNKLERLVAQPKPQSRHPFKSEHTTYQTANSNEVYDSNLPPATPEEIRVFRQEQKRNRRLIKEENRRKRRRDELRELRVKSRTRFPKR
uniref:FGF n=1 Tax=Acrobeloides nanus TaxID=290746 RepID=A0A914CIV5_9BILA